MKPNFYKLTVLPDSQVGVLCCMENDEWVTVQASNEPREYMFLVAQINHLRGSTPALASNGKTIEYFVSSKLVNETLKPSAHSGKS